MFLYEVLAVLTEVQPSLGTPLQYLKANLGFVGGLLPVLTGRAKPQRTVQAM